MPNGDTGIPTYQYYTIISSIIVPQPANNVYYIFIIGDKELLYVIVDMSKNNGLGDVVQKAKSLPVSVYDSYGHVAVVGNCDQFWLFTPHMVHIPKYHHKLLRFEISPNGLNTIPDTIEISNSETYHALTFSPNGKKVVFNTYSPSKNSDQHTVKSVLCDFNLLTGEISNPIVFAEKIPVFSYAFSPDCLKLYTSTVSTNDYSLRQFDLTIPDSASIENSQVLIHQFDKDLHTGNIILSPNGKIICEKLQTSPLSNKSDIIEFPNKKGLACSFKKDAMAFYIFIRPNFVSTFLSPQFDETFDVNAGVDQEACTGASVSLGVSPQPNTAYQWQPTNHLSDPVVANPAFLHADTLGQKTVFQYIIEGKRGYCLGRDTVTVTIHPDKYTQVSGSKSVCPRVTGVDYWAEADDRFRYEWSIEGGDLVSGQHSDSITVDWGATNPAASVTLTPYNTLNCPSDPITFPLRINVELQTETPVGDELLCSNLATDIPYHITNTNGSVYTWESDAGNILQGQGTNKVRIDWPGDGRYHLWVKEQSTTIDTVCYGVSDSLLVNLFTDSTKLEIDYAGVMRENPYEYELQWYASDTGRLESNIEIFTSYDYSTDWQLKQAADKQTSYYAFADTVMNYAPMSFKISSVNGCREYIESEVHTTIFLEGMADSSSNSMNISWTPYLGWGNNIKQYEVWYSKDDDAQMSLVASMKPGQHNWSNHWGAEAFNHQYRIRAIHNTYPFESWSNQLTLSFDHAIEIPNVFTPNGDGINDTFSFPKLELFHENELQVYDRNGSEVYSKQNYNGNWAGGDLSPGVYYYSFTEKRNQKTYKGWVQILR